MLIVDTNQIMIASVMVQIMQSKLKTVDENLLRHMAINSLRSNIKQFKGEYGPEIVLAFDSAKTYWRREFFPYYKMNRNADRDKSGLDWIMIFQALKKIREEIREFLPYKTLQIDGAEADDIIAVLAKRWSAEGRTTLILSGDKDFQQLQNLSGIKQYSPVLNKYLVCKDPARYLKEHIISGDRGDGIPNILSDGSCFVNKVRQKSIGAKKLTTLMESSIAEIVSESSIHANGWSRNETLIDFRRIPDRVQADIIQAYEVAKVNPKMKMLNYFMEKGLKQLTAEATDF